MRGGANIAVSSVRRLFRPTKVKGDPAAGGGALGSSPAGVEGRGSAEAGGLAAKAAGLTEAAWVAESGWVLAVATKGFFILVELVSSIADAPQRRHYTA